MIAVDAAGLTDVGQKRKGNEDAFLIDEALQLYVVADGMGGRKAGEVASRLVVETIRKTMRKLVSQDNPARMVGVDRNLTPQANQLVNAIRRANLKSYEYAQNDESCNRKPSERTHSGPPFFAGRTGRHLGGQILGLL